MALSLNEFLEQHPVDRQSVNAHKQRMYDELRAHQLRELRENAGLTQSQLAERIGVGQRQVSKIERGDLDGTKVGTIRRYLAAVGGDLALDCVVGGQRVPLG